MYSEENVSAEDVRKYIKKYIPGCRLITSKSITPKGDYRCYIIAPEENGWVYLHRANKLFELANILTNPRLDINKSSIRRGLLDRRPFPPTNQDQNRPTSFTGSASGNP